MLVDGAIYVVGTHSDNSHDRKGCEQLRLLRQLGVNHVVVFINGGEDLLEMIDLTEAETREVLKKCGCDGENTPIVRFAEGGSTADSIAKLIETLDSFPQPSGQGTTQVDASQHTRFEAAMYFLDEHDGGKPMSIYKTQVHVDLGTIEVMGSASVPEERFRSHETVLRGEYSTVTITLDEPAALREMQRISLPFHNRGNRQPIIAQGFITRILD